MELRNMRVLGLLDVEEYTLPPATGTTLGGVIVPASSGLTVDASGNLGIGEVLSISSVDSGVQIASNGGIAANALTFDIGGIYGGATLTATQDGLPGLELQIPNGTVRAGLIVATEGVDCQAGLTANNIILTQPTPGVGGGVQAFEITANATGFGSLTVNGLENNTAMQTELQVDGSQPITIASNINCLLVTLSQDVDTLTINLPSGPMFGGTVVEICVSGNVTNLNIVNPTGFAPLLGAPTSVSGYLACKFRFGVTLSPSGAMGFFLVA
jgi:hypothetical protein